MKLRTRLAIVVLCAFVPAALLVGYDVQQGHREAVGESQAMARNLTADEVQVLRTVFERTRASLIVASASPSVPKRQWAWAEDYCRRVAALEPLFMNFAFADAEGKVRASAVPVTDTVGVGDRAYFVLATRNNDFATGGYQIGRITRRPVVVCAYPTRTAAGKPDGVVYAALDVDGLAQTLDRYPLPAGAVITLFDGEGRIVARRPDAGMVGRLAPESEVVAAALHSGTGSGGASMEGLDGVPRQYAYERVLGSGATALYVSVGIDERVLFGPEMRRYATTIVLLVLAAVVVLLVALRAGFVLVHRPLVSLREVADRLAQGDLEARANLPPRGDEIGDLAAACDGMAEAIHGYVERIEKDHARTDKLLRMLPVGVFVLNDGSSVRYVNEAGLRMLGVNVGRRDLELAEHIAPESQAAFRRFLATVRRRGRGAELEVALAGSGRETVAQIAGSFVEDEHGEPRVVIVAADVTERHLVDRLKSDFLAMVSHELRTPLTAISGFAQLLEQPEHQERASVKHMAERIEERASHLTHLVENLLHVLQAEARSFGMERRRTDVKALVDVCVQAAVVSPAHRIEVIAPSRLRRISCDQLGLQQALGNLIENALKFSPDGGTVTVRIEQAEHRTRISVQDEGIGVPAEVRDAIFERFVQADMSSTRSFGGFGLGLFLVKQVAEAHGGTVTVEDAEPRGSIFTMEIAESA